MPAPSRAAYAFDRISRLISDGAAGDRLPSEKELAATLGVSRVTVRDALMRLWHEGAIVRRWGAGTYIAERRPADAAVYRNLYIDASSIGSLPSRIAERGLSVELRGFAYADGPVSDWVRVEPGFDLPLWRIERTLAISGRPGILMIDYVPTEIGGIPVDPSELRDLGIDFQLFLARYGQRVVKQESTMVADVADDVTARNLGLPEGTPVLAARQRSISEHGDVIGCSDVIYRSDVFGQVLVRTLAE
ncbi:hypothetical protein LK09_01265 [Microbacterium mangrovi]|uniref:HTH gntR-type domain-containing protein n=1 Tax=Microbacterium mangrovi TaxID=1348253 RepID=A0A0B2A9X5_9MICO|nr:GntR family transcriptional regulator [Microbacterium mangrovi]KHK99974.1 hypothetical protein LK09_01265 [Microbacterium mangrovi]